ncbi:lipase family protein [Streptomyces flaveolus]
MAVPVTLDHRSTGYSLQRAYWLALASDLAYKNEATIEQQARQWGFDTVRHHETRFAPPFPLQDTQAYTMASDDVIVTAFRGTEPQQIKDWLSDATTPPREGPAGTGHVRRLRRGPRVDLARREEHAYRTAHQRPEGLVHRTQPGRALATLAGARMYLEEPRLAADGVYTYGQPRTCDAKLAKAYNQGYRDRMYRFVNNNDIVPQMPPAPPYTHVDALRYIDSRGTVRDTMPVVGGLLDHAAGFTADPLAPASDGVRDHFINSYLTALEKNLT